jgi:hypothetical protein
MSPVGVMTTASSSSESSSKSDSGEPAHLMCTSMSAPHAVPPELEEARSDASHSVRARLSGEDDGVVEADEEE